LDAPFSTNARQVVQSEGMKLRHAAALALVVWYLMTPPPMQPFPAKGDPQPDLRIPLTQWHRSKREFAAKEECLAEIAELRKIWWTNVTDIPQEKITARQMTWFAKSSQCIATDDPRVKGN
jgi:hypothetical protein